jgi:bacillithiol biosynthesis cysteine-adding enzyme BshC
MLAGAFLPRGFGDPADRRAAVAAAAIRHVDPALLVELRSQNARLPQSEARRSNVDALAIPGTFVVATGQQVGLFLGPLYTLYKAATAIAAARALARETGKRCVPLFWLQTEDHDFAEIATCHVPRIGDVPLQFTLGSDAALSRVPIRGRPLGAEIGPLLESLDTALADEPNRAQVLSLLREHYRPEAAIDDAFAGVLAALFAEDGLVIYNPRQPVAAGLLAPMMRTALLESPRLERALEERGRALHEAGFAEQVATRPGSPLFFFHREDGARFRLQRNLDSYALSGAHEAVGEAELLQFLVREPLRFSTSALLRPIAQDLLFPVAAYVGGPAEVDYFAQLSPLYSAFGLEPPLVVHRARLALVLPRVRSLLQKLELSLADLERPREELLQLLAAKAAPRSFAPDVTWTAEYDARLLRLAEQVSDRGFTKAVERTRAGARRSLDKLIKRHQRFVVEHDQVRLDALKRAEAWLRPDGVPQERIFSFPWFAAHLGIAGLRQAISSHVDPFDPSLREVDL